jgi:CRISPR/Cas system CMR-associated protein Cmr5 small subunit
MSLQSQAIVKTELLHPEAIEDDDVVIVVPQVQKTAAKKSTEKNELQLWAEKMQIEAERLKSEYEQAKERADAHTSTFLCELDNLKQENQLLREKVAQQESEAATLRSEILLQKKKHLVKVRKLNNKWARYIMQNFVK